MANDYVRTGSVKLFIDGREARYRNKRNGYGFIIPDDGDRREVMVHYSHIVQKRGYRKLDTGERVRFIATEGERGPVAVQVWHGLEDAQEIGEDQQAA
jgi:cold shock protein